MSPPSLVVGPSRARSRPAYLALAFVEVAQRPRRPWAHTLSAARRAALGVPASLRARPLRGVCSLRWWSFSFWWLGLAGLGRSLWVAAPGRSVPRRPLLSACVPGFVGAARFSSALACVRESGKGRKKPRPVMLPAGLKAVTGLRPGLVLQGALRAPCIRRALAARQCVEASPPRHFFSKQLYDQPGPVYRPACALRAQSPARLIPRLSPCRFSYIAQAHVLLPPELAHMVCL